ncbi:MULTISPECIES: hypothetical protein [Sporosarcina]|uniref:hypothetical protein n=1 Tax=Sporosarcina TaxID=1569 RepID=UPI00058ED3AD|nr:MULTISPECIES: hypothetical protein [Sporosarcina]WJY28102.1 hypothetical protein QWT68_03720 [Sporosarcina sp. 0.2-SM1T-5]
MAFGINRNELKTWKADVQAGKIAFLTHYWLDDRFPGCKTVTKAGCTDVKKLIEWGRRYGLKPEWIDYKKDFPHFDLFGEVEVRALEDAGLLGQARRFGLV